MLELRYVLSLYSREALLTHTGIHASMKLRPTALAAYGGQRGGHPVGEHDRRSLKCGLSLWDRGLHTLPVDCLLLTEG